MSPTAARKNAWRQRLFDQQRSLCHWCQKPMKLKHRPNGMPTRDFATFEHVKRRRDGGHMGEGNVVLAHYKCNRRREHGIKVHAARNGRPSDLGKAARLPREAVANEHA
jgi:hypothetical protein